MFAMNYNPKLRPLIWSFLGMERGCSGVSCVIELLLGPSNYPCVKHSPFTPIKVTIVLWCTHVGVPLLPGCSCLSARISLCYLWNILSKHIWKFNCRLLFWAAKVVTTFTITEQDSLWETLKITRWKASVMSIDPQLWGWHWIEDRRWHRYTDRHESGCTVTHVSADLHTQCCNECLRVNCACVWALYWWLCWLV